jgi:WD40 repeat protein
MIAVLDPATMPSDLAQLVRGVITELVWSPVSGDNRLLVGNRFTFLFWNIETNQMQWIHTDKYLSFVSWSADGASLAAATYIGAAKLSSLAISSLTIWDIATGSIRSLADYTHDDEAYPMAVAWHPTESNLLACGYLDGHVEIWNVSTNQVVDQFPMQEASSQWGALTRLTWNADGSRLGVGYDRGVAIWDVENHKVVGTFQTSESEGISDVRLNPNGSLFAINGGFGIKVIQPESGAVVYHVARTAIFSSLTWNADGSKLLYIENRQDGNDHIQTIDARSFILPPTPTAFPD